MSIAYTDTLKNIYIIDRLRKKYIMIHINVYSLHRYTKKHLHH